LTCIIPSVKEITSKYSRYRFNNKFAKKLNVDTQPAIVDGNVIINNDKLF
jgi:hypothetical protein